MVGHAYPVHPVRYPVHQNGEVNPPLSIQNIYTSVRYSISIIVCGQGGQGTYTTLGDNAIQYIINMFCRVQDLKMSCQFFISLSTRKVESPPCPPCPRGQFQENSRQKTLCISSTYNPCPQWTGCLSKPLFLDRVDGQPLSEGVSRDRSLSIRYCYVFQPFQTRPVGQGGISQTLKLIAKPCVFVTF